jgi:hypothetical protein
MSGRRRIAVATVARVACGAGGGDAARGAEETVSAQRYRTWVVESAIEASHGGGQWIEELFFPEKGVVANVVWEADPSSKETFAMRPVLNVFDGGIRNRFKMGLTSEKTTETPVENVKVSASLARAVFEAADLRRRLEAARRDLGPRLSEADLCRALDADGKPGAKMGEPVGK